MVQEERTKMISSFQKKEIIFPTFKGVFYIKEKYFPLLVISGEPNTEKFEKYFSKIYFLRMEVFCSIKYMKFLKLA